MHVHAYVVSIFNSFFFYIKRSFIHIKISYFSIDDDDNNIGANIDKLFDKFIRFFFYLINLIKTKNKQNHLIWNFLVVMVGIIIFYFFFFLNKCLNGKIIKQ